MQENHDILISTCMTLFSNTKAKRTPQCFIPANFDIIFSINFHPDDDPIAPLTPLAAKLLKFFQVV